MTRTSLGSTSGIELGLKRKRNRDEAKSQRREGSSLQAGAWHIRFPSSPSSALGPSRLISYVGLIFSSYEQTGYILSPVGSTNSRQNGFVRSRITNRGKLFHCMGNFIFAPACFSHDRPIGCDRYRDGFVLPVSIISELFIF